jgi:peptidoglycan/LPS O-acetylase OafA/YrhL
VISGYLITLLLMAERSAVGRVDLVGFWVRRARRLLPALFVMLFLLLTYTLVFRPSDALGKLRGDCSRARCVRHELVPDLGGAGVHAVNDFVPLRHLWSLAVEEQFYLVWPVVMLLMLRKAAPRRLAMGAPG